MKRPALVLLGFLTAAALAAPPAHAGSPHFINNAFSISRSADTLTVSGKEAGLGDEAQIHVVLTATASCINPGGNHPKAANKTSVSAEGDFPVQNGKAEFSLSVTATFQPDCLPPMTLVWTSVTLVDSAHDVSATFNL